VFRYWRNIKKFVISQNQINAENAIILSSLSSRLSNLEDLFSNNKYMLSDNMSERIDLIRQLISPKRFPSKWTKRMGDSPDGGYYVPILNKNSFVTISCGAGTDISFDSDMSKYGPVFLYDGTVDSPLLNSDNIFFFNKNISLELSDNSTTLESILIEVFSRYSFPFDLVVKMDIEGDEWDILESLPDSFASKIYTLIVEFHNLSLIEDDIKFDQYSATLKQLSNFFVPIYFRPNNFGGLIISEKNALPEYFEVTYISKNVYKELFNTHQFEKVNSLRDLRDFPNSFAHRFLPPFFIFDDDI